MRKEALLALVGLGVGLLVAMSMGGPEPDEGGREDEGGTDPPPPPPGDATELDGGPHPRIVNLLDESPPEKRVASRPDAWAAVLHQMGFSRGDDPRRYRKVTAHYIITPNGTIAQLHPIHARLNAAHGFNRGGVSIEFAGNFPSSSRSSDPSDFWSPDTHGMDQLTVAQVEAGRWLLGHLRDTVHPSLGFQLTTVLAHRQSSGDRGNDPGPDVWTNVGQYAVDNMGLKDGGPGFSVGTGKPILASWRTADRIA